MSSKPALVEGHGRKSLPAFVLLGSLVSACIIVGLLLMHGLNTHSMPATPQYTAATIMPISSDAANRAVASHQIIDTTPTGGCADCESHSQHLAAGAACFLALFVALMLLHRPTGKILRGEWFSGRDRVFRPILRDFARTPSLHELCISRT